MAGMLLVPPELPEEGQDLTDDQWWDLFDYCVWHNKPTTRSTAARLSLSGACEIRFSADRCRYEHLDLGYENDPVFGEPACNVFARLRAGNHDLAASLDLLSELLVVVPTRTNNVALASYRLFFRSREIVMMHAVAKLQVSPLRFAPVEMTTW